MTKLKIFNLLKSVLKNNKYIIVKDKDNDNIFIYNYFYYNYIDTLKLYVSYQKDKHIVWLDIDSFSKKFQDNLINKLLELTNNKSIWND